MIIILTEYPFLAEKEPAISSLLQEMIDLHYKEESKLMIILCGSSTSFMEKQVLGYKSSLYGRRTAQMKLEALSIWDIESLFPNYSAEERFMVHAVTNGIPMYLEYMIPDKSVDQNIIDQFFYNLRIFVSRTLYITFARAT